MYLEENIAGKNKKEFYANVLEENKGRETDIFMPPVLMHFHLAGDSQGTALIWYGTMLHGTKKFRSKGSFAISHSSTPASNLQPADERSRIFYPLGQGGSVLQSLLE